jgi:hypothetical protein
LVTGCGHSLGRRDYGIREIAEGTFHRLRLKELQKDFRKTHVDE